LAEASPKQLTNFGITNKKAESIIALSRLLVEEKVSIEPGCDPDMLRNQLRGLIGIDPWTIEYLLMKGTYWPDALPSSDLGLLKTTGMKAKELEIYAERWRAYRSHAVMLLWQR
jgi:AraC family transcriptional regulator, regulatory protein of adaptative response / DNA-3-methyladenine glycosylase II